MTDQEINIAIAKESGWEITGTAPDGSHYGYPPNGLPRSSCSVETIPNYCHDLNAMHEAEETLSPQERFAYVYHLVTGRSLTGTTFDLVHLTARQRAEAFLRVKGLWRDDLPELPVPHNWLQAEKP